ncbi:MAG: hypothetical protein U0U46_07165 [Saprospiraceae bacterium]
MNIARLSIYLPSFLLLTALLLSVEACTSDRDEQPRPNVSGVKVDVQLLRFEQDLFSIDTTRLSEELTRLEQKYPEMLPLFAVNIIHDQTNPNETPVQAVGGFVGSPQIRQIYDTVQKVYGDLRWLQKDLDQMFRYYKFYFPQKPVPQVVTMVSEFATDAFTYGDSLCGVSLDMYLGENYLPYLTDQERFPAYLRRQFRQEYIPVRLAKALVQNLADAPPGDRLLDQMLYNGKQLYILDCLLPDTPDSLLMGYTTAEIEGCQTNEAELWARLLEQNLLYSSDFNNWRKLVTPSPNAPILFQEAPGEVGSWMGWQIVKAYMRRHPQTTLTQLLGMSDSQQFLEQAKYKPKRQ